MTSRNVTETNNCRVPGRQISASGIPEDQNSSMSHVLQLSEEHKYSPLNATIDPQANEEDANAKAREEKAQRARERRRKMMEEDEKAEQEHQELMLKKEKENADRMKKELENEKREESERVHLETRRIEEEVKKMVEEQEWRKDKLLQEVKLEDQKFKHESETMKKQGNLERQERKEERLREKEKHEKISEEQDIIFNEGIIKMEEETKYRNEELLRKQKVYDEKIQRMVEQLEKEKKELHKRHGERMNQMKRQWEQIIKMFQFKVWNEIIERNWTNRLNVLRSGNRKVAELYGRFYSEAVIIQRRMEKEKEITENIQMVLSYVNALIESVKSEKEMMMEEIIQLQSYGNSFVIHIRDSLHEVKRACDSLQKVLERYSELIEKNQLSTSEHNLYMNQIKESFDELCKFSNDIPTMAELKSIYREEMKQHDNSCNTNQDIVPFQSVFIEEIE